MKTILVMHEMVPKNTAHFKSYFGLTFLNGQPLCPCRQRQWNDLRSYYTNLLNLRPLAFLRLPVYRTEPSVTLLLSNGTHTVTNHNNESDQTQLDHLRDVKRVHVIIPFIVFPLLLTSIIFSPCHTGGLDAVLESLALLCIFQNSWLVLQEAAHHVLFVPERGDAMLSKKALAPRGGNINNPDELPTLLIQLRVPQYFGGDVKV